DDAALVAADPVRHALHLDQVDRPVRVGEQAVPLSATRLVEEIGSRYGVRIRLREFLRAPTPETLIQSIRAEGSTR
ncbi:phosphopantetheine-binding protein, partial [Streptosporangium sp. NPDC006013]|uniref:phosphopantetheine-binding protein n=1 Tax=Streptosporangium sp. NPDC006013 TaxID=3155596 RepID=UPI0033BBC8EA